MGTTTIQGATPTFTLRAKNESVDLTTAENIYVSFKQGKRLLIKETADLVIDARTIGVYLTQEDTLSFAPAPVELQVNVIFAGGQRAPSPVKMITIGPNHIQEVLT